MFPLVYVLLVLILCVRVFCLHVCMCTTCMSGALRSLKSELDSLKVELGMVVSHPVGAEN